MTEEKTVEEKSKKSYSQPELQIVGKMNRIIKKDASDLDGGTFANDAEPS